MTDHDFLLEVLADGRPHSLNEILRRSFAERGCGLTVHSRAVDLRAAGHRVANWKDGERGDGSWYRLLDETDGGENPGGSGSPAGVASAVTGPSSVSSSGRPGLPPSGAAAQLDLWSAA